MKNLLEFLLNRLVDNPEDVEVREEEQDNTYTYFLKVHSDDIGRVIGKNGSVINAIRTIARIRALKEDIRVRVEIDEE